MVLIGWVCLVISLTHLKLESETASVCLAGRRWKEADREFSSSVPLVSASALFSLVSTCFLSFGSLVYSVSVTLSHFLGSFIILFHRIGLCRFWGFIIIISNTSSWVRKDLYCVIIPFPEEFLNTLNVTWAAGRLTPSITLRMYLFGYHIFPMTTLSLTHIHLWR